MQYATSYKMSIKNIPPSSRQSQQKHTNISVILKNSTKMQSDENSIIPKERDLTPQRSSTRIIPLNLSPHPYGSVTPNCNEKRSPKLGVGNKCITTSDIHYKYPNNPVKAKNTPFSNLIKLNAQQLSHIQLPENDLSKSNDIEQESFLSKNQSCSDLRNFAKKVIRKNLLNKEVSESQISQGLTEKINTSCSKTEIQLQKCQELPPTPVSNSFQIPFKRVINIKSGSTPSLLNKNEYPYGKEDNKKSNVKTKMYEYAWEDEEKKVVKYQKDNSAGKVNHKEIGVASSYFNERSSEIRKECSTLEKSKKKTISDIYSITRIGYSSNGSKTTNQDSYFIFTNLNNEQNIYYLGVCDGHGLFGHEVSKYLKNTLPINLNMKLKMQKKAFDEIKIKLNQILEDVFLETNNMLVYKSEIDTTLSGSTCISVILSSDKIICANVGDSRAVLGRYANGKWVSCDLSRDHKPSEEKEAQRIVSQGGKILPSSNNKKDEMLGPPRVWLKNENVPGLAMTRSFGDKLAATVGIIAKPEIRQLQLIPEDKFLIIASDGIWQVLGSDECVNLVKEYYVKGDIAGACDCLYRESAMKWLKEEEKVDDITAILVFFG